jgi:hypothetical protein
MSFGVWYKLNITHFQKNQTKSQSLGEYFEILF